MVEPVKESTKLFVFKEEKKHKTTLHDKLFGKDVEPTNARVEEEDLFDLL